MTFPKPAVQAPPTIAELTQAFLASACAADTAFDVTVGGGVLEPYEVGQGLPIDAGLAWQDAFAAIAFSGATLCRPPKAAPEWGNIVAQSDSSAAIPLALGNFPQAIVEIQKLLEAEELRRLRPRAPLGPDAVVGTKLLDWVEQQKNASPGLRLAAVGVLRRAGAYARARALLPATADLPGEWATLAKNEEAATLWAIGECEAAEQVWANLPAGPTTLFNRGLAALFADRPSEAEPLFRDAIAGLPEDSAWHHLGCVYRSLAELRRTMGTDPRPG